MIGKGLEFGATQQLIIWSADHFPSPKYWWLSYSKHLVCGPLVVMLILPHVSFFLHASSPFWPMAWSDYTPRARHLHLPHSPLRRDFLLLQLYRYWEVRLIWNRIADFSTFLPVAQRLRLGASLVMRVVRDTHQRMRQYRTSSRNSSSVSRDKTVPNF